jgi:hypothetical protein
MKRIFCVLIAAIWLCTCWAGNGKKPIVWEQPIAESNQLFNDPFQSQLNIYRVEFADDSDDASHACCANPWKDTQGAMADQALPCLLYYLLLGLGGGMEITLRLEQLLYILKSFVIMDVHLIFHIFFSFLSRCWICWMA